MVLNELFQLSSLCITFSDYLKPEYEASLRHVLI